MEKEFGDLPGDKKIEVSPDHRTLIIVKYPNSPTVMEICVVGSPGNLANVVNVDIQPGKDNALDVYHNEPKEDGWIQSLPASEYDKGKQSKSTRKLDNKFLKISPFFLCKPLIPFRPHPLKFT